MKKKNLQHSFHLRKSLFQKNLTSDYMWYKNFLIRNLKLYVKQEKKKGKEEGKKVFNQIEVTLE